MMVALSSHAQGYPYDRLFIAVDLPEESRGSLARLREKETSIKWTGWSNLHLTLRFIGRIPADLTERIKVSLRQVKFAAFTLELNGLGLFQHKGGTVLWAGLAESPPLAELKQKIEQTLIDNGLAQNKARFTPHITLARVKKRPSLDLRDFVARYSPMAAGAFNVAAFALYKSDLRPSGAEHTALERYPAVYDTQAWPK